MANRLFKDSWSAGMKQMIANMTDAEYDAWLKDLEIDSSPTTATKGNNKQFNLTDKDIEAWAERGRDNINSNK